MGARNAIVLGAGIGGLLAARALSDHVDAVLVLERDEVDDDTGYRRSIPQGHHAHGLLAKGHEIMEGFFPGLTEGLRADGVPTGDLCADCQWSFDGHRVRNAPAGLPCVPATRPVLERHLRRRSLSIPNVELLDRTLVEELVLDGQRVVGVRVSSAEDPSAVTTLPADLVVDATGRGSRLVGWLQRWGYGEVEEDRVGIDLAYTTRQYRLRRNPFGDDGLGIIPVAGPSARRGAFFYPLPGSDPLVSELSLTGILGDHAPTDPEGFEQFARTLPVKEIFESIVDAEPLSQPVRHRFPHSYRRRFERLKRCPAGVVAIGDAVCSFNPVYGQGMTAAAMGAELLAEQLRDQGTIDPRRFFAALGRKLDAPWQISAGGDLAYPEVEGRRPASVRLVNAYVARLQRAAVHDPELTVAFMRTAGLVEPPASIMYPHRLWKVLRKGGRRKVRGVAQDSAIPDSPGASGARDKASSGRAAGS